MNSHRLDQQGQRQIQQAGYHNAAAGVLELFRLRHGGINACVHAAHGGKAAQESEGGTQKSGNLQLGAKVEQQSAEASKEQGGLDGQGHTDRFTGSVLLAVYQNGHQDGSAKHGEHMLKPQDQHFGYAQLAGVPDRLRADGGLFFLFHLVCSFQAQIVSIISQPPTGVNTQRGK